jgi:hypothetical protein
LKTIINSEIHSEKELINLTKAIYQKILIEKNSARLRAQLSSLFKEFFKSYISSVRVHIYYVIACYVAVIDEFDEAVLTLKKRIFSDKEENNYYAVVLVAYFEDMWLGGINQDTLRLLEKLLSDDASRNCVIEILKAWRFEFIDRSKYEECLNKAFSFDEAIPQASIQLGRHLINNGLCQRGKKLLEIGLSHIKRIVPDNEKILRELDPEAFIDCYIKGYSCSESEYKRRQADLFPESIAKI